MGSHCTFPAHSFICREAAKCNEEAVFNWICVTSSKLKLAGSWRHAGCKTKSLHLSWSKDLDTLHLLMSSVQISVSVDKKPHYPCVLINLLQNSANYLYELSQRLQWQLVKESLLQGFWYPTLDFWFQTVFFVAAHGVQSWTIPVMSCLKQAHVHNRCTVCVYVFQEKIAK